MKVYKLVVCFSCLLMAVGLTECKRKRRRREVCEKGTYEHEGETCCMCPSGHMVISDCTKDSGTACERCMSGMFATHPNNDKSCRHCTVCHSEANLKIKEKCSSYSDTVCECEADHFCDKGHLCRTCQACDTCGEQGVKIHCTPTNNTVCNDAKASNGTSIVVPVVVVVVVVTIICIFIIVPLVWFFRKRKGKMSLDPTILQPLQPKKVDLNPYLQEITSILPSKLMIDVARRTGMTEPNIEQHKLNNPNDVKEQTYQLLKEWSQTMGLGEAYPTLIKTIGELKKQSVADEITQIVERKT